MTDLHLVPGRPRVGIDARHYSDPWERAGAAMAEADAELQREIALVRAQLALLEAKLEKREKGR